VFKVIGGTIVVFGLLFIRWAEMGRSPDSMGVAARRDLSPFRIARPYNRWGIDARCDIWTLCGVFIGAVLGLGLGWMLGSLPLGILLAGVAAPIGGWRYRVVASLLAVERHADAPDEPREAGRGARDGRVKLGLAAVLCGVAAALVGLSRVDAHGPIAVVGFVAIVLFVAWSVMRIMDRQRVA